jgi:hypothetical protein
MNALTQPASKILKAGRVGKGLLISAKSRKRKPYPARKNQKKHSERDKEYLCFPRMEFLLVFLAFHLSPDTPHIGSGLFHQVTKVSVIL